MSITRNFLFSSVLTVSGYVFPIIVYPHVSRALGVNNLGICNFVDSIIDYFILVSMLGIATVGVREIAEARHDRTLLSRRCLSILLIGGTATVLALGALIACTYSIAALEPYKPLLLIGIIKLLGNFLLLDWFYQGIEDFRYITIRTIAVKTGYAIAVFIWVWNPDDYIAYYTLWCLSFGVNALLSCTHIAKIIDFRAGVEVRRIIRPILILGLYMLITSMYTTFNTTYLGFEKGDTEVGYYTTASKLLMVLIGLYTAFTRVMIPRMSTLFANRDFVAFRNLEDKAVGALIAVAIPLIIVTVVFAEEIIKLFAGSEFLPAAVPARIIFGLIFVIGYEQIIVLQVLLPMKKDNALFVGSMVGAVVGLTANFLLVPVHASTGSAIAWVVAEVAVLISGQLFVMRYLKLRFPFRQLAANIGVYLPLAAVLLLMWSHKTVPPLVSLIAGCLITAVYSVAAQVVVLRNEYAMAIIRKVIPFIR